MVLHRTSSVNTLTGLPTGIMTRSMSVSDLTQHVRSSPKYKPHWPKQYGTHSYRDWSYDLDPDYYFWDKSWYRLFHTDRHPYYWTAPYTNYRATFRNYIHNTNFPYYRFITPYFNSYYNASVYRPYVYSYY